MFAQTMRCTEHKLGREKGKGGKQQRHEIFLETRNFHVGFVYPLYVTERYHCTKQWAQCLSSTDSIQITSFPLKSKHGLYAIST
jgi:hypothetical protein